MLGPKFNDLECIHMAIHASNLAGVQQVVKKVRNEHRVVILSVLGAGHRDTITLILDFSAPCQAILTDTSCFAYSRAFGDPFKRPFHPMMRAIDIATRISSTNFPPLQQRFDAIKICEFLLKHSSAQYEILAFIFETIKTANEDPGHDREATILYSVIGDIILDQLQITEIEAKGRLFLLEVQKELSTPLTMSKLEVARTKLTHLSVAFIVQQTEERSEKTDVHINDNIFLTYAEMVVQAHGRLSQVIDLSVEHKFNRIQQSFSQLRSIFLIVRGLSAFKLDLSQRRIQGIFRKIDDRIMTLELNKASYQLNEIRLRLGQRVREASLCGADYQQEAHTLIHALKVIDRTKHGLYEDEKE